MEKKNWEKKQAYNKNAKKRLLYPNLNPEVGKQKYAKTTIIVLSFRAKEMNDK